MLYPSALTIDIGHGEYWYGGCVADGVEMPFGRESDYSRSLLVNPTGNQAAPLLFSSQGRYIWCKEGFAYTFGGGRLTVSAPGGNLHFYDGFGDLRGAYRQAARKHFTGGGKTPPELFFTAPQYNTWIELMYRQNQRDILAYAQNIVDKGMPVGVLMIDCGWAEYNGCMEFHSGRFPDPAGMIAWLHSKGFRVMLWESPFVTADSVVYRQLAGKGYLVRGADGEPAIKHWWDGYSAVLDMTNPGARDWLREQNAALMDKYGVDGFKMDAGDARYYSTDDRTYAPVTPNEHCELWARFGLSYDYNEYRACFKCSGEPLVQRLSDKCHSWESNGLRSLIPNILAQGILGYPYGCPDMIGGGEYMNFLENSSHLDEELVVRYAQCSALLPMMQFSAAPWRILGEENFRLCREAARLHVQYGGRIYQLAREAAEGGDPIVRYMEYVFPHQGLAQVTDQFMLGEDILVAPVLEKNTDGRLVRFPAGNWQGADGEHIAGPCSRRVPAGPGTLPVFTREE